MSLLDRILSRGAPATPQEAESGARGAANVTDQADWETTDKPTDETIAESSLRARRYRVVSAATVEAFRAWLEQATQDHRGYYEGWEGSAKP